MPNKVNIMRKFQSWSPQRLMIIFIIGTLAILIPLATVFKAYPFKSFLASDYCSCSSFTNHPTRFTNQRHQIQEALLTIIHKIERELHHMRDSDTDEPSPPKSTHRHASFLADILGLVESVSHSLPTTDRNPKEDSRINNLRVEEQQRPSHFLTEEIRKYVRAKPNRLGKRNFMGSNSTFTAVGHGCFAGAVKRELEEYMSYDIGDICNDDWRLAQKLMVQGCDPLPRRRCFARAPQYYTSPLPAREALWAVPDDRNIRWSQYICKSFACLASNGSSTKKGFFKCIDCFDLKNHEPPRWVRPAGPDDPGSDFTISEVLDLKPPGEIRVGLDFSVGTGTFAARMRERNVTVASAVINLGAPFSETVALRGLLALYLTVNQRLPFFDNTLDLIHTTRFLDGWIDLVVLEFVLYDWDRVLRPGGILWVDGFFCLKEDLDDYLQVFGVLRYKKLKWTVVPKRDKSVDREVLFSAVLEKPARQF